MENNNQLNTTTPQQNFNNSDKENSLVQESPGNTLFAEVQIDSSGSSVQTREIAAQMPDHSFLPSDYMKPEYKIDIRPWIARPFMLGNSSWAATAPRFSILSTPVTLLPRDIFRATSSLTNLCRVAAYYRMKLCINVSLTGTISHQGTLLVGILPPNSGGAAYTSARGGLINTILSGPHAFLSANEASSVCLEVPWYQNTDYGVLDPSPAGGINPTADVVSPNSSTAVLSVYVLNPLVPATGATTSLNVVYEAFFKEFDLYVPSPRVPTLVTVAPTAEGESLWAVASKATDSVFDLGKRTATDAIDAMRSAVRNLTGLHNPNIAKLDTKQVMSFRNYANNVDSGTCMEKLDPYSSVDRVMQEPIFHSSQDEMLIKSIISKPQYLGTFQVTSTTNTGTLLWCGPISPYQGGTQSGQYIANNIELLHHCTRAWKGDLKLHIQSAMSNKHSLKLKVLKYYAPPSSIVANYPTMASIQNCPSDLLEYSAGNQTLISQLPYLCRNRLTYCSRDKDTEAQFHGMYYIYLAQPLVGGDAAPLSVEFNVYMSCGDNFQFYGYSKELGTLSNISTGESAAVMNRPSTQKNLLQHSMIDEDLDCSRLVPLTDIRPLIRRFQQGLDGSTTIPASGETKAVIPLSAMIAEAWDSYPRGSNGMLPAMFYGKNPGIKFKLKVATGDLKSVLFVAPNILSVPGVTGYVSRTTVNNSNLGWSEYTNRFPLPLSEWPTVWQVAEDGLVSEFEFVVPNTTILKFIGGTEKMFSGRNPDATVLASSDLGQLVFSFAGSEGAVVKWTLYYAFTDETRFGFQVIAPVIQRLTSTTTYVTPDSNSATTFPAVANNPYVYFSNLTTPYT